MCVCVSRVSCLWYVNVNLALLCCLLCCLYDGAHLLPVCVGECACVCGTVHAQFCDEQPSSRAHARTIRPITGWQWGIDRARSTLGGNISPSSPQSAPRVCVCDVCDVCGVCVCARHIIALPTYLCAEPIGAAADQITSHHQARAHSVHANRDQRVCTKGLPRKFCDRSPLAC